ncbi:hypothetical protein PENFLA_c061G10687 [Penicillium flavigenum]|uniref:Uncharacterized protein n=1 Tax=Penicillium flavigenum TaxID=254877 RepID=A0A1V6SG10_9EURO|nr:hypothetical protein PENFLA_c061G10687 [Penicillium flavigenum]
MSIVGTLVYKEIFGKLFMNPWWYLDGKMSPTDEGDETFSTRLQQILRKYAMQPSHPQKKICFIDQGPSLLIVNPLMASLWRSETNRLANSANVYQAASTLLGTYHKDRRESFVDQFVNDTLSVEPIR